MERGWAGTVFQLQQPSVEGGTWTETTLYSFKGVPDGYAPNPGLTLAANGDLYGTTSAGGTSFSQNPACPSDLNGCGTVFRLAPPKSGSAWQESVLYRFSYRPPSQAEVGPKTCYTTSQVQLSIVAMDRSQSVW